MIDQAALPAISGDADIRRHYQSVSVGVRIPVLQSLITGASIGVSSGSIAWLLNDPRPWVWGLTIGFTSQTVAWLLLLRRWQIMIRNVEAALGIDIDGDGLAGNEPAKYVRAEVVEDGGKHIRFADLPGSPEQLETLAESLIMYRLPFSESEWCGQGKPFSKREFHALRKELFKRKLATWKNPRAKSQGIELTRSGVEVMKQLLPTPSPTGKNAEKTK